MKPVHIFNGPVEVGLRALILLVEAFPETLDLQRLVTLDYFLIHSGDVEKGPESLHPPSPLRSGEVAIRRTFIENGLTLYRLRGLILQKISSAGFTYVADDHAAAFLDAIKSTYVNSLRQRAEWALARFGRLEFDDLNRALAGSLSTWQAEFVALPADGDEV